MLSLIAAVALVLAASITLGTAVLSLSGYQSGNPLAAPVGFAALLTVTGVCIHLPGGAGTCSVVLAALLLAAVAHAIVRWRRVQPPLWTLALAGGVVVAAMIPFAAAGHVGLLGVGTNDDLTEHLLAAWTLQGHAPIGSSKLISSGYPIGPHAIAAVISTATGLSLQRTFTGLIVAVPALLSLAAAALVPARSTVIRSLAGAAVGLCYLQSAYLVQASFKEPIESVILVGWVAALSGLERDRSLSRGCLLPLAVLGSGSVYVNSYLGLLWPGGTLLLWLAVRAAIDRPTRARLSAHLRALIPAVTIGGTVFALLILPDVSRMIRFAHSAYNSEGSTVFGNLLHRLPPLEAVGIWPRLDFRFDVPLASVGGILAVSAALVIVGALIGSVRRREFALPAALIVSAAVFAATSARSPYTAAKALVIAAPLATLLLVREVLVSRQAGRRMLATLASVLLIAGAYSDLEVLRDGPVGPAAHPAELASFRPAIGHQPTLFLGADDFVHWELRGARLATPPQPLYADQVVPIRRAKALDPPGDPPGATDTRNRLAGVGLAFDFDSVPPGWLDRFTYAIRPRSSYVVPPPSNWRLVRATPSYELWRREGPTAPSRTLNTLDNPGATLDCGTAAGRSIAASGGVALVQPSPVVGARSAWRGSVGFAGRSAHQTLALGAGSWDLSLQYAATRSLTVHANGLDATLPGSLEPLGPDWYVGRIQLARAASVRVTVTYQAAPLAARLLGVFGLTRAPVPTGIEPLGRITASRPPAADRVIRLVHACGRYVDWYRVS